MSDINIITPISIINNKNNNTPLNTIPYHALIDYCAIRKQFSRIIPNYYINTQNNLIISNKIFSSDSEEYNKLKNEIKSVEDSILALKEKKEKKLEQIKELREIMRKVGNKKINITDKKIIRNNYYNREKNDKQCFKGINKEKNGIFKVSSEEAEGISSNATTRSGLSSEKDDDAGCEEEGYQQDNRSRFNNNFNNNHSSWCFIDEENKKGKDLDMQMQDDEFVLQVDN